MNTMSATGVISDIIEKVSFANYLPLLSRATADNNDATPGYMFEEITDISFQPSPNCQQLSDYLTRRLERPSACVKLKVLKIIYHLVKNGHAGFRQGLRRNDGSIKIATMYNGVPDPLLGMSAYEMVRKTAQDLLDVLFDPESIRSDDDECGVVVTKRLKSHMAGLGSCANPQGKYEGFGSSPLDKGDTIKGKVIEIIDKYMNPVDDTAKTIQSALTSSPGDYEPVPVVVPTRNPVAIAKTPVTIPVHIPGRAGGGWESEEEDIRESTSIATTDSLDTIEAELAGDSIAEKQIVTEFCNTEQWPVSLQTLHDVCHRCTTLNCVNAIKTVAEILRLESSSDIAKTRALLILEWFLRTDLVSIATLLNLFSSAFDHILHEESNVSKPLHMKTKKVRLIMDKLATRSK